MKNKGLIVLTAVTVAVLVVAVVTVTFAWFSSGNGSKVGDVTLEADAIEGLLIGASATTSPSKNGDYMNGSVTWDGSNKYWKGGSHGLGASIEFKNLAIKCSEACTKRTEINDSEQTYRDSEFLKGAGNDSVKPTKYEAAAANVDYLDLTIGVGAATADQVKQAFCTIVVKPTGGANIGMAAAIHFDIYIDGTKVNADSDIDAFSGKKYANNYADEFNYGEKDGENDWKFGFIIFNKDGNDGSFMDDLTTKIYKVRIVAWIEGDDEACVAANAGTGATISISFGYAKQGDALKKEEQGKLTNKA